MTSTMYQTPYITKQIGRTPKLVDISTEMLSQRIVFLTGEICDDLANAVIKQLLWLSSNEESDQPIDLYIQSPGGSVTAGYAIKDVIDIIQKRGTLVNTIAMGSVSSMGAFLLCAGTGERKATKNARIMIHSVSSGAVGSIQDLKVSYEESKYLQDKLMLDIANMSKGKSTVEDITRKCERDCFLGPDEAITMGIIDKKI